MPYYEDIVHLCDIPRYHAKHNPDEIAFIYEDKQTTYKDFDLKTEKVANGLVALGVQDQDRVAFMDKNSDIFCPALLISVLSFNPDLIAFFSISSISWLVTIFSKFNMFILFHLPLQPMP